MNWFIIKNIIKGKRTYTEKSEFATKLLHFIAKRGKYLQVCDAGLAFSFRNRVFIIECKNFPNEDMKTIYMITPKKKFIKLVENVNPSKFSRIRMWLFADKYVRTKAYIKLVNCALQNNSNYDISMPTRYII